MEEEDEYYYVGGLVFGVFSFFNKPNCNCESAFYCYFYTTTTRPGMDGWVVGHIVLLKEEMLLLLLLILLLHRTGACSWPFTHHLHLGWIFQSSSSGWLSAFCTPSSALAGSLPCVVWLCVFCSEAALMKLLESSQRSTPLEDAMQHALCPGLHVEMIGD